MVMLWGTDVVTSFRCYWHLFIILITLLFYFLEPLYAQMLQWWGYYLFSILGTYKNRLINISMNMKATSQKSIKAESWMSENTYKIMYPTGASASKFYGPPKIHKKDVSLRPIVSSIGSFTCGVAIELARILTALVGKSIYHVNNSRNLQMKSETPN